MGKKKAGAGMSLLRTCTGWAVGAVQVLFRPCKVKRRVVFVSYFSPRPEGNLKCVLDDFKAQYPEEEVRTLFCAFQGGWKNKLKYVLHTLKEVYYFSTSRLIVLEGNSFVLSKMRKKKGVLAMQLWHAAGAFKKFGVDTDRLYAISGLDGAVVSCPEVCGIYAHALNIPKKKVVALGIPRADIYHDPEFLRLAREKMEEAYPDLKGKKIALYAPTFRGGGVNDVHGPETDIGSLEIPGWAIAVRMHPMLSSAYPHLPDFGKTDLMTALAAADLLISDYSSVIFEYSLLGRPMLFYCPDRKEYAKERGFYFGFADFVPGRICETREELERAMVREDFQQEKVEAFARRFTYGFDGKATRRTTQWLWKHLDGR